MSLLRQQLWLFVEDKPLRARLGEEFFRKVPKSPGVYIMTGRDERVLYVGQSRNLHQRLLTYKNLQPGKDARKLVRLAQHVEKITWELCDTPENARRRENELLRLFRPKFNTVNTHPEAYGYVGVDVAYEAVELWLTRTCGAQQQLYGAFKSVRFSGYAALLRLLLCAQSATGWPQAAPVGVLGPRPPQRVRIRVTGGLQALEPRRWAELIGSFLDGHSDALLQTVRNLLPPLAGLPVFWQVTQALDFETAAQFFTSGPKRNLELKQRHDIQSRLLQPEELDDLACEIRGSR